MAVGSKFISLGLVFLTLFIEINDDQTHELAQQYE